MRFPFQANPSVTRVGWKLNGHLLDSAATMPGIEIRNTSLLVSNVNHNHDHGKYECYAENRLGTSFSESLLLDVRCEYICFLMVLPANLLIRHNKTL